MVQPKQLEFFLYIFFQTVDKYGSSLNIELQLISDLESLESDEPFILLLFVILLFNPIEELI